MDIQAVIEIVENEFKNYRIDRLEHTLGVYEASIALAKHYNLNKDKVALAALFHDFAKGTMSNNDQAKYIEKYLDKKYLDENPNLYHAIVAADMIEREFGINDRDIIDAIYYHVTGHPNMNIYAKVLYIADVCEKNRHHYEEYGKEYFDIATNNIDKALYLCAKKKSDVAEKIHHVKAHPLTIELMNKYKGVMDMNDILKIAVKAADDKLAQDIVILNMEGISPIVDYFVICHGTNERQMQAIAREIREKTYQNGYNVERIEGYENSKWILIDLGDVIVHVFDEKERYTYHLEKLWGDVPRMNLNEVL